MHKIRTILITAAASVTCGLATIGPTAVQASGSIVFGTATCANGQILTGLPMAPAAGGTQVWTRDVVYSEPTGSRAAWGHATSSDYFYTTPTDSCSTGTR